MAEKQVSWFFNFLGEGWGVGGGGTVVNGGGEVASPTQECEIPGTESGVG